MQPERGALNSNFDAFSLREPVSISLENALVLEYQPRADRAVEATYLLEQRV